MSQVAKNMDSVFANSMADESEFDVIFDQEDSLIDTVNGVNEAGDPLTGVDFVDLHQTQDNATPKDFDHGADEDKMGAPNPEGAKDPVRDDNSVKGEVGKSSDADDLYGDAECDYQCDKDKSPTPDEDSVEDTIEKVIESWDEESDPESIDDLDDEDDEDIEEACKDGVCEGCGKPKNECSCGVKKEGGSMIDDLEDEVEFDDFHQEATGADSDVEDALNADIDDDDLDAEEKAASSGKYSYEPSDEDIIDAAINGDTE